jgi:hypothetical protein
MGPQSRKNWRMIYDRYGNDIANGYFADRVAEASKSQRIAEGTQSHKRPSSNRVNAEPEIVTTAASR